MWSLGGGERELGEGKGGVLKMYVTRSSQLLVRFICMNMFCLCQRYNITAAMHNVNLFVSRMYCYNSCIIVIAWSLFFRRLDVPGPLYLGAPPPSLSPSSSQGFYGCLGNLTVDGELVDLSPALGQASGVEPGCPPVAGADACNELDCDGECVSTWNGGLVCEENEPTGEGTYPLHVA